MLTVLYCSFFFSFSFDCSIISLCKNPHQNCGVAVGQHQNCPQKILFFWHRAMWALSRGHFFYHSSGHWWINDDDAYDDDDDDTCWEILADTTALLWMSVNVRSFMSMSELSSPLISPCATRITLSTHGHLPVVVESKREREKPPPFVDSLWMTWWDELHWKHSPSPHVQTSLTDYWCYTTEAADVAAFDFFSIWATWHLSSLHLSPASSRSFSPLLPLHFHCQLL